MSASDMQPLKNLVIVGGGSAGWMAAAALSRTLDTRTTSITLVESDAIGTVGVGEATIPDMINFNQMLGIKEADFMRATDATFKLGIEFVNWGGLGERYFHPFGSHGADMQGIDFHHYWLQSRANGSNAAYEDYSLCAHAAKSGRFAHPQGDAKSLTSHIRYAYHFDATRYARFLRDYAEGLGVERVEGRVVDVGQKDANGDIASITLEDGRKVTGDFFFDCTGFRALLMRGTLETGFQDWSEWLPCNSAQTVACAHNGPLPSYTRATAHDAGWQWRIPTQKRTGNGHIYCDGFTTDEAAVDTLTSTLDGEAMGEPRKISFTTGRLGTFWRGNCVALGLSAGFLEPLESTSLYLIQVGLSKFITLFPDASLPDVLRAEYNRQMADEFDQVRDFLVLHYIATQRDDTEFWRHCLAIAPTDSLRAKMELFRGSGHLVRDQEELFGIPSWTAVMLGQNLFPERVNPVVASLRADDISKSLGSMRGSMANLAARMPSHDAYLDRYCRAQADMVA